MSQPVKGRWGSLLLGAAILSFGLFNVHSQSRITEGGVLGMTLLVQHWLHISPSVTELVLDALCYGLGCRLLGKGFLVRAAAATGAFSLFYALWERVGFVLPDMTGAPLAAALVGGVFVGVGVGLVVRAGGAAGGDDAIALVISKVTGWNISKAYLMTDFTVLGLSLSYIPVASIACSMITVTLSSFIIGQMQKTPAK